MLLINFSLAITSASQKSITVDEFAILPAGLAILQGGSFHMDPGVPPLSKIATALPAKLSGARLSSEAIQNLNATVWQTGFRFAAENTTRYQEFFSLGRLVSIFALALSCLFTFLIARKLYNTAAGLWALFFCSLSPNLLAHGRLATSDIFLTVAVLANLYALIIFLEKHSWRNAAILGITAGLACLCKFTGLLLLLVIPFMIIIHKKLELKSNSKNRVKTRRNPVYMYLFFTYFTAAAAINIGYLFNNSFIPLSNYHFVFPVLENLSRIFPAWLPVPFPEQFFTGIDAQMNETGYDAYLLGKFNTSGFWNYYIVAFLTKLPLPLLFLPILVFLMNPRISKQEAPIVFFGFILFCFFSLIGHKNIGIRYLLFLIPLICVWIGRGQNHQIQKNTLKSKIVQLSFIFAALSMIATTYATWPHYLPYFNIAAGGPDNGHKYLLDSNLDWGQDLIGLKTYMAEQNITVADLAYFGRVPPEIYGIPYTHFKGSVSNRYVVISANLLWGRMYFINGTDYWPEDRNTYGKYRNLHPEAIIGHSLYVFDMQRNLSE